MGVVQGAVCCGAWRHPLELFLCGREAVLLVELEAYHQRAWRSVDSNLATLASNISGLLDFSMSDA